MLEQDVGINGTWRGIISTATSGGLALAAEVHAWLVGGEPS